MYLKMDGLKQIIINV